MEPYSHLQPSDGMLLIIGPRLERHSVIFLAIQTHSSGVACASPSIPSAYAGAGLRRNSSIRRGISRNRFRGAATSANWNVTYRPWRTTLTPVSRQQRRDQGITTVTDATELFSTLSKMEKSTNFLK